MAAETGTPRPRISIIMPAYNSAATIGAALASVVAQTFTDWEALIVDDGSTDPLASALAGFAADPRIRLLRLAQNSGVCAARNAGLDAACGEFVAFLDADDAWLPEKLAWQLAACLESADPRQVFCVTRCRVDLAFGAAQIRPDRAKRPGERLDTFIFVEGGFCQTSAFFLHADLARRLRFRPLPTSEDHLFAIDALAAGAEYRLLEPVLTIYRQDPRPDRLSARLDLAQGRAFLAAIGEAISPKARLAFEARYLGPLLLRENPMRGLWRLAATFAQGALRPRFVPGILARAILGEAGYARLRAWLIRQRG